MKKIVFLTLSLTSGGAERVISNMCNEYFVEKYDVTIISLMAVKPEYDLDSRIDFVTIDGNENQYKQNMAIRFLRRRRRLSRCLNKIMKDGMPAAIISFLPEPNMLICSLASQYSVPIIISVRNDPVKEYGSKIRSILMKSLYPKADKYVFQTPQARDYFRFSKHILDNSFVIPNPISREFIQVETTTKRTRECVAVGRLEDQKDPMLLIRAFGRAHEVFPEITLSFYGEGSLRNSMQEEIQNRGLSDCVFLKGNTSNVKAAICDAALFVLSSKYEGMPNALMEAMALGLPCVATDCPCGGPASLIEHGLNGLLVPIGDEDALTKAMLQMLVDSQMAERMGHRARSIVDRLNPDTIYKEWDEMVIETD